MIPDLAYVSAAEIFQHTEGEVVAEAVKRLGDSFTDPPSRAHIVAEIRAVRENRNPGGFSLPAGPVVDQETVHESVRAYLERVGKRDDEVMFERFASGREAAEQLLTEQGRFRDSCSGIGKEVEWEDGQPVCPDCRMPVDEGCRGGGA